jgi:V8-like Glu-specific endopeptidase
MFDVDEIAVEYFSNGTEKYESVDELITIHRMRAEKNPSKEESRRTAEHFDPERVRRLIFDDDERLPVSDTSGNPYCAVGRIDYGCTAVFIGPYHAITAAHCVYDRSTRSWRNNLDMNRARTCNSRGQRMIWSRVRSVVGYITEGRPEYDYALIIYDSRNPSPCWLSFGYSEPWSNVGLDVIGYPLDKPDTCFYNRMWSSSCHYSETAHQGLSLIYRCDTALGNDGSALYGESRGDARGIRAVYGVNAYEDSNGVWNFGPRINEDRYDQITQWMVESGYHPTEIYDRD